MALNIDALTDKLVDAFTETNTVTAYSATNGQVTEQTIKTTPSRSKMKKLATEILNHIKDNADVYNVSTTVAPGIPLASPAGPGSTTGIGKGTQSNFGKVR